MKEVELVRQTLAYEKRGCPGVGSVPWEAIAGAGDCARPGEEGKKRRGDVWELIVVIGRCTI